MNRLCFFARQKRSAKILAKWRFEALVGPYLGEGKALGFPSQTLTTEPKTNRVRKHQLLFKDFSSRVAATQGLLYSSFSGWVWFFGKGL